MINLLYHLSKIQKILACGTLSVPQTENISDITFLQEIPVLLVISKMILKTLDGVSKPALAGLWPNKNNMSVVLDLGANIEVMK